jgi:predicted amidohydrolase YtcJ
MKTLFYNGLIYTSNPEQLYAESMVVEDGIITYIGDFHNEIGKEPYKERIDLKGQRVLPGMIDAHMHPLMLAEVDEQIYCGPPNVYSIQDIKRKVQEQLTNLSKENTNWLCGWGYDEAKLEEKRTPTKWDLDDISSDIPIILTRTCTHIIVANSMAMKLAGVTADTISPYGGEIEKREDGELTGVFKETARDLIYQVMPRRSEHEKAALLAELSHKLLSQGITATTELMADPTRDYDLFKKAFDLGYKQKTVLYYLWDRLKECPEKLSESAEEPYPCLQVGGIKLFGDGSVSGKTAWMAFPYLEEDDNYGLSTTSVNELLDAARTAKNYRVQLVIHAMGERAIEQIVDTFQNVDPWIKDAPSIRIEHAAFPTRETLLRAIKAGIGFVTQPLFLFAEYDSYVANVGKVRTDRSYPFKTMLELGAVMSFSSDAPATSWQDPSNPFLGIKAAVTRTAYTGDKFNVKECLSIEGCIDLYTRKAQEMTRIPKIGQLKKGYDADFIILDKDILHERYEDIDKINVVETYIRGNKVYSYS